MSGQGYDEALEIAEALGFVDVASMQDHEAWLKQQSDSVRRLTVEELADLSNEWENPTVDTAKYYQNVVMAWEVNQATYSVWKSVGGLCQQYAGHYYIA